MARILAIADEVAEVLYGDALDRLRPDLVLSCGDLPFEYLENLVTRAGVPLVYVLGNHDPDPRLKTEHGPAWPVTGYAASEPPPGPQGCDSAEGRVIKAAGLYIAARRAPETSHMRTRSPAVDDQIACRRSSRGRG